MLHHIYAIRISRTEPPNFRNHLLAPQRSLSAVAGAILTLDDHTLPSGKLT